MQCGDEGDEPFFLNFILCYYNVYLKIIKREIRKHLCRVYRITYIRTWRIWFAHVVQISYINTDYIYGFLNIAHILEKLVMIHCLKFDMALFDNTP